MRSKRSTKEVSAALKAPRLSALWAQRCVLLRTPLVSPAPPWRSSTWTRFWKRRTKIYQGPSATWRRTLSECKQAAHHTLCAKSWVTLTWSCPDKESALVPAVTMRTTWQEPALIARRWRVLFKARSLNRLTASDPQRSSRLPRPRTMLRMVSTRTSALCALSPDLLNLARTRKTSKTNCGTSIEPKTSQPQEHTLNSLISVAHSEPERFSQHDSIKCADVENDQASVKYVKIIEDHQI